MHRIERAIIMAAGKGVRLMPLTKDIPKPLIKVNGKRMIESIIDALHANDIHEIYIVVGYLKESFEYLKKIEGVKLIENPYYDSCNNISSLYVARNHIENAIILDGDQIIYNPAVLHKDFELSGYSCVWTDSPTKEWVLTLENGIVSSCSRVGADKGFRLLSVSRWSSSDAKKLKKQLETEFEQKQNRQIFWDDVALFCYPEEYKLGIIQINDNDVIEIDSLDELIEIDSSYKNKQEAI